jgi:histidinol-phosphate aminotransferase
MQIEKYIRIDMGRFGAYSPCKSPEVIARKLGIQESQVLKLDANENPYGCSPKVREALARYPYLNIYPDANQTELREALAKYVGLGTEYIVAGNGSDELIDLLLRVFLEVGDEVITATPTFDMYRFCTQVCRGKVVEVIRADDFTLDAGAIKKAITEKTRVIFIANPNNPTGTLVPRKDIVNLLELGLPLVLDEAYYEFSRVTMAKLAMKYENLIVLRTFSKWAGLAGLRVGYGIFAPKLADVLLKVKPPYNVNAAAVVAAQESLKDTDYLLGTVNKMIEERGRLLKKLQKLKFLRPIPSQANFVLCEVIKGQAKTIQDDLENQGILVRYYATPLLKNYIRISVGKPEHTDIIIGALKDLGEKIDGEKVLN